MIQDLIKPEEENVVKTTEQIIADFFVNFNNNLKKFGILGYGYEYDNKTGVLTITDVPEIIILMSNIAPFYKVSLYSLVQLIDKFKHDVEQLPIKKLVLKKEITTKINEILAKNNIGIFGSL